MTPVSRPTAEYIPRLEPEPEQDKEQVIQPERTEEPQYYYQPYQDPVKTDLIDRNIVIIIFVAFIAGLLLGKIMNPVILRH